MSDAAAAAADIGSAAFAASEPLNQLRQHRDWPICGHMHSAPVVSGPTIHGGHQIKQAHVCGSVVKQHACCCSSMLMRRTLAFAVVALLLALPQAGADGAARPSSQP